MNYKTIEIILNHNIMEEKCQQFFSPTYAKMQDTHNLERPSRLTQRSEGNTVDPGKVRLVLFYPTAVLARCLSMALTEHLKKSELQKVFLQQHVRET